jgi:hypothetical protein
MVICCIKKNREISNIMKYIIKIFWYLGIFTTNLICKFVIFLSISQIVMLKSFLYLKTIKHTQKLKINKNINIYTKKENIISYPVFFCNKNKHSYLDYLI